MAKIGKQKADYGIRRVSPIKPGLRGAKNWASAQLRSASYNPKKFKRMLFAGVFLFLFIIWLGLYLGGFMPYIRANYQNFVKQRLMGMGFVVKTVDVVGEGRVREARVKAMLGVKRGDYIYDMDIKRAQARIEKLGWVDTVIIRRLWPNRIIVHINERRPYALWQNNARIKLVDIEGRVISGASLDEFAKLPFIVGAEANKHADELLKLLARHSVFSNKVDSMVYVGKRRWDIVLDNGVRILLPEKGQDKALAVLAELARENNLLNRGQIRIDMRLNDRIGILPQKNIHQKQIMLKDKA